MNAIVDNKLTRFAVVGGVATFGYVALYWALAGLPLLSSDTHAAFIAYSVCAVYSYVAHKHFTFKNDDGHVVTGPRFALTTIVGMVTAVLIALVGGDVFALGPMVVGLVTAVAIPVLNLILLDRFVFRARC